MSKAREKGERECVKEVVCGHKKRETKGGRLEG